MRLAVISGVYKRIKNALRRVAQLIRILQKREKKR